MLAVAPRRQSRRGRAQAANAVARTEADKTTRQLESTRRELVSLQDSRRKREHGLQCSVATMRAERAAEVQMLAGKLEESLTAYNRSAAETERVLTAKEALLRKYKAEAQSSVAKLAAAEVRAAWPNPRPDPTAPRQGVRHEALSGPVLSVQVAAAARAEEAATMRAQLQAMHADNEAMQNELQSALAAADEGRAAAELAARAGQEVRARELLLSNPW